MVTFLDTNKVYTATGFALSQICICFFVFREEKVFLNEVQVMAALDHPNIVCIYGVLLQPAASVYGIVMEYMDHGSLSSLMEKIPSIPWPVKVSISYATLINVNLLGQNY